MAKNHILHGWILTRLQEQFMKTMFKLKQAVLQLIKGLGPHPQKKPHKPPENRNQSSKHELSIE